MSDSTAPTLTAVSIASNNSTKTDYACQRKQLLIYFSCGQ